MLLAHIPANLSRVTVLLMYPCLINSRLASGFFFSSRRRHTRWTGDWSSDVCSSDLPDLAEGGLVDRKRAEALKIDPRLGDVVHSGERAINFTRDGLATKKLRLANEQRSEERRVGKEGRSGLWPGR